MQTGDSSVAESAVEITPSDTEDVAGRNSSSERMGGFAGSKTTGCLIFAGLRPEPRDVGSEIARLYPESVPRQGTHPLARIVQQPLGLAAWWRAAGRKITAAREP